MPVAILSITCGGRDLAANLAPKIGAKIIKIDQQGIAATIKQEWSNYDGLIFIMAAGIVVRTIAPLLQDKKIDPGVVVVDETGKYAISLLSGHLGGGNQLAKQVARALNGKAVITTASDTLGLTALDLWARYNSLLPDNGSFIKISSLLVNHGELKIYSDICGKLPDDFIKVDRYEEAELIISNRLFDKRTNAFILRPRNLVLGIGCNRGTSCEQIGLAVNEALAFNKLAIQSVHSLCSIDLKNDEAGLLNYAAEHNLPMNFFSAAELNTAPNCQRSEVVYLATGAYAVAEPAALLGAQNDTLLIRKMKWKDVTIAIAEKATKLTANYQ